MEEYPLEQLVIIKKKRLEEAEKLLSDKKKALENEETKLASVEKERDQVKEHKDAKLQQLRDTSDAGTTSDKIIQMKQYLKVVDEQLKVKVTKVKDQQKLVDGAKQQVEQARENMLKKQQDVEKMQIHRKEWEKEMKVLMERQAGIETDEMGSAMHGIRAHKKAQQHKKKS